MVVFLGRTGGRFRRVTPVERPGAFGVLRFRVLLCLFGRFGATGGQRPSGPPRLVVQGSQVLEGGLNVEDGALRYRVVKSLIKTSDNGPRYIGHTGQRDRSILKSELQFLLRTIRTFLVTVVLFPRKKCSQVDGIRVTFNDTWDTLRNV